MSVVPQFGGMTPTELLTRYRQGERNFSGLELPAVDLSGASLVGINLQGANLSRANLSHGDLRDANLQGVNFDQAQLHQTCLLGANLTGAFLATINRHGAWAPPTPPIQPAPLPELSQIPLAVQATNPEAELTAHQLLMTYAQGERRFTDRNLSGIDCQAQELNHINFQGSNLTQANFRLTDLQGANFSRTNLTQANLSMADLRECDFSGANLTGANLSGADRRQAIYDAQTQFPKGFNPEIVGMVKSETAKKTTRRRQSNPS